MNTFFLDRLNSEPHALAFAGQSTPWPVALADQSANPALDEALHTHAAAAQALLYPVSAELLATTGRPVDLFGFEPNPARLGAAVAASASVPGIALTQLGALLDAAALGYNPAQAKPVAVLGHSQGVLAVHMVQAICEAGSIDAAAAKIDEILAIATLIGVAGTRQARQLGLAARHGEATPMLSVKDITRAQVDALIERVDGARGPIAVAVTNSATHYVLSGYPEDLAAFGVEVAKEHKRQAKLREEKVRGGRVFGPTLEYLDVTLPFHSPLMADAVSQAVAWAEACGINVWHRIFRHLIPNVIPQLIVTCTMSLGSTILTEATLSFLGLGVKYPFASWGNIINDVNNAYVMTNYLFIWVPAGICLLITVLGFNFVGDGLRDAFDPKMKR
mgnify:CR=1 FL=1